MREITLFTVDTPYRQKLEVKGWQFGNGEKKSLAVMGALRGNEIQQTFICSQLIQRLQEVEERGQLSPDCGVLVVPCADHFSMNVGSRFWAADHTDINRMFPGYDLGETTQRIAARIFQSLQGYRYGVQMASFYLPGDFLPHVRMMETGYQHTGEAQAFGLPYVVLRTPQPYDTTTLNYNWQIWDTQAFPLYTKETDCIDRTTARLAVEAVLRFLVEKGLSHCEVPVEKNPCCSGRIRWRAFSPPPAACFSGTQHPGTACRPEACWPIFWIPVPAGFLSSFMPTGRGGFSSPTSPS